MSESTARSDELHELLIKACPPDKQGRKSISILAANLGLSFQGVYRWVEAGRIKPDRAREISELEGCGATLEEFTPFFFAP